MSDSTALEVDLVAEVRALLLLKVPERRKRIDVLAALFLIEEAEEKSFGRS